MITRNYSKILRLTNFIIRFVLIFFVALIWARYFIKNIALSLVVSGIIALIITAIIEHIINKKSINKLEVGKKAEEITSITNTFLFSSKKDNLNFFYNLAKNKHDCILRSSYIEIASASKNVIALVPFYEGKDVEDSDLIKTIKEMPKTKVKKIIFCCANPNKSCFTLAQCIDSPEIIILDSKGVYEKLLCEYDYYPEAKTLLKEPKKLQFKDILSKALNKKRTKGYFFTALILIFSSLVVKSSIYYLIFATVLLMLTLFSWLNPKFNKQEISSSLFD